MSRAELVEHLTALLQARVLDPKAAVDAAFSAGFMDADRTWRERNSPQMALAQAQAQALGVQGKC